MFGLEWSQIIMTVGVLASCGLLAGFFAGLLGIGGGIIFVRISRMEIQMFGLEWSQIIMTVGVLASCGLLAGFFAGLLGIGGGIIFVPVFFYVFQMFGLEWSQIIMTVGVLASCGLLAGFFAGLLGIGGGIIFVPVFFYVFMSVFHVSPDVAMVLATGTSLTCMIPTSITAAIAQYKRGNTNLNTIKVWAPGMLLGVLTGSLISSFYLTCMIPTSITAAIAQYKRGNTNLNTIKVWAPGMLLGVLTGSLISSFYGGKWLAILFGSIMILNALNTFFRAKAKPMLDHMPNNFIQRVIAFCISFLSVMLGIGGGTLTVPVLNACGEEPHRSIGTSSAVSLFVAVPGAIVLFLTGSTPDNAPMFTIGYVSLLAAACVIPLSVLTAPFGVSIGKKISPVTLKRIFAVNAPMFTIGYVSLLAAACVIPLSVLTAPFGVSIGKKISPVTLKRIFAVAMFIVSVRMIVTGIS